MKRLVALFMILVLLLLICSSLIYASGFPYVTDKADIIQVKVAQVPIPWQFWAFDPATGNVIDRIRISPTWLNPPGGLPPGSGNILVRRQYTSTTNLVPLEDMVWGTKPVPGRTDLSWTTVDSDWVQVVLNQDLELNIQPPSQGGAVLVAYEVKTDEQGGGGGGGGGGAVARFINEATVPQPPAGAPKDIVQILVNFDVHNDTNYDNITNFELDFANLSFTKDDVMGAIGFVKAHGIPPVDLNPVIPWGANPKSYLVVRPINNGTGTEVKWVQADRPLVYCDWLHVGLVFNYNANWNNVNSTVQGYWTTTSPVVPPVPELPAGALLGLGLFGGLIFLIMKKKGKLAVFKEP
jgi:hypothetical protein